MNAYLLEKICQNIKEQTAPIPKPNFIATPLAQLELKTNDTRKSVKIKREDRDKLVNFVKIYTDHLKYDYVLENFKKSDYKDQKAFEADNVLYNLGFFYVKVNPECSASEFLGLIACIPFKYFCLPGTDMIEYSMIKDMLEIESHEVPIQLMVLGHHFRFWKLINPAEKMKNTKESTRLLISGMGGLMIKISPRFIRDCVHLIQEARLIENFKILTKAQQQHN